MENDFLNKKQVAEMLTVTQRTIDYWIAERNFPCVKITGKKRLFSKKKIIEWVNAIETANAEKIYKDLD